MPEYSKQDEVAANIGRILEVKKQHEEVADYLGAVALGLKESEEIPEGKKSLEIRILSGTKTEIADSLREYKVSLTDIFSPMLDYLSSLKEWFYKKISHEKIENIEYNRPLKYEGYMDPEIARKCEGKSEKEILGLIAEAIRKEAKTLEIDGKTVYYYSSLE